ncbi:MAG: hypothetical protein HY060_07260 [Proteobacteria bacterium]|nr:hypothetical protein [Pseudomonadota bacterium]
MQRYDPLVPPDPQTWLALAESERLSLVQTYHRRARIRLPNLKLHAVFHVIVENQIATGDEIPVKRTLERLMGENLDRHEAIHAISFVLAMHLNDILKPGATGPQDHSAYFARLEGLTAESWRREAG